MGKVDVTGFHTGAYIAPELAVAYPDLVRRVVLSGVPFWQGEELEQMRREMLVDKPLKEKSENVLYEWKRWVNNRNPLIPLERAYDLFASAVLPGQQIWWAYYGVVNYDARPRFKALKAPTLLINPAGEYLAVTTRAVMPLLTNGKLIEAPELPHQMYDIVIPQMARMYRDFLDGPT